MSLHAVRQIVSLGLVAGLASAAPARGAEVVVQNDSLKDGDTGAIQAGFIAGESASAWLKSPCKGKIVAVQVLWMALFGGQPSIEDSITISKAGAFPVPGSQLAFLEAPYMTPGFLNEFRYLDEAGTIPLQVAVLKDELFVVSFKFYENPSPIFGPSVVTDVNGCQAGKNGIFAIPGGWKNACALGISGDFVIRAVVDCAPPCPGDIDGDGAVGQGDLGILLAAFGHCAPSPQYSPDADLDADQCVDQADLGFLLGKYGTSCGS